MPSALSHPEFLTSRRHLAAAGVGLAVVVALATAAGFAPAPGAARPVATAASPAADLSWLSASAGAAADAAGDDPAATAATVSGAPRASDPTAAPTPDGPAITALAAQGIPIVALEAYRKAAALQAKTDPGCHLAWTLVAAIGAVESGHGTHAGSRLYADGQDLPRVIGPVLDGTAGNARIADTDKGVLDADKVFDRAVGPMQFIPSTWARHGVDGNGDGKADPFNIYDAAATTGGYLCAGGGDLATEPGRVAAVFSYNHLDSYVLTVLALDAAYAGRPVVTTSPSPAAPPAPTATPTTAAPTTPKPSATAPKPAPSATTTTPAPTPTPTPTCPTGTPTGTPTTTPTSTTTPTPTPTSTTTPSSSPTPLPTGCPTTSRAPGSTASSSNPAATPSASVTRAATPSATPTPTG